MNQIKSNTNEVTLTDLKRMGREGDATARLFNGDEIKLTSQYGLLSRKGYIDGRLQDVQVVMNYTKIYKDIRTIKRGNVLIARRMKHGKDSILQLTGKGYHRPIK